MIVHHQSAIMEDFLEDNEVREDREKIVACAEKMLENIELQIQVTYDYHQLKALYQHKEVIKKMISKNTTGNSSVSYG
mgnify:FL=1